MGTISNAGGRIKRYIAGLAMAALLGAVLAVSSGAGPAQAQVPGDEPPLCGPGQSKDNFPDQPLAEVSRGHYAIFDAYWLPAPSLGDDARAGTLNNNLCPPAAKHSEVTVEGHKREVTTLSRTNIDLRSTIIHVDNTHLKDVVATDAEAGDDKLSLEKYIDVRTGLELFGPDGVTELPVPPGTQVYWLRLENTARNLPPSSLVMGFSTGEFEEKDWYLEDDKGNPLRPFQYELEAVRYHGPHADKLPQVLTYWEPDLAFAPRDNLVWNSLDTDVNSMPLGAGEYEHLEWVFTHAGTYILEVHLKGHVRQLKDKLDGAGADWAPITDEDRTVTSEVREYVFQVGPLTVNENPAFGVMRSVEENSAGGTKVGDPIKVFTSDSDALTYSLAGPGADKFNVAAVSGGAQITVADGADLDYETKRTYHLVLSVRDGKDHENNPERDVIVDDTIIVQVNLTDVTPYIVVHAPQTARVGQTVTVRGSFHEVQGYVPVSANWNIQYLNADKTLDATYAMFLKPNGDGEYDVRARAGIGDTQYYRVVLNYQVQTGSGHTTHSELRSEFSITWLAAE